MKSRRITFFKCFDGNIKHFEHVIETDGGSSLAEVILNIADEKQYPNGFYMVTDETNGGRKLLTVKIDRTSRCVYQVKPGAIEVRFYEVNPSLKLFAVDTVSANGNCYTNTYTEWDGVPVAKLKLPGKKVVDAICQAASTMFADENKLMEWLLATLSSISEDNGISVVLAEDRVSALGIARF